MNIAEWRRDATARLAARLNTDGAAGSEHDANTLRVDAEVLLALVLQRTRTWLYAHADEALNEDALHRLERLLARRQSGEPLAYITGHREFRAHRFRVTEAVLVPRDDTEVLVDATLACIDEQLESRGHCRVLDAGTGSGIVATCLALERAQQQVQITASDIDASALDIARHNATALNARVDFLQTHWLSAIGEHCIDIVASNPPYVAAGDTHLEALTHEPQHALVAGAHGLDALHELITAGQRVLAPQGHLLLEHGFDQCTAVTRLLHAAGYVDVIHHHDLAGHVRVTRARVRR